MMSETRYSGRTTHIQAGQEPTVQDTASARDERCLLTTNGPCVNSVISKSAKRLYCEVPEKFKVLRDTCPAFLPFMPSRETRIAEKRTLGKVTFQLAF